jgi:ubiquinone/menaquinone biosynthesis C-methylase UbiE
MVTGSKCKSRIKLDIGPGEFPLEGFDGVGVDPRPGIKYICEWGKQRLPFEDNQIAQIYASHVLEHIEWYRVEYALSEAYRVLMPKGAITLHLPDFKHICLAYLNGKPTDKTSRHRSQADIMRWVNFRLFNAAHSIEDDTPKDYMHRAVYDQRYLTKLLLDAGFSEPTVCSGEITHHGPMNLGLRAIKPESRD